MSITLTDAERRRIAIGAEQAREDFENSGSMPAKRAHRDLMKLLEEDDRRRASKDAPQ
ncbi:hypothetical protein [uncultured Brevundimonas sp.]|uniref:hypothetical protein n=1 Tax=uncultured Brevundimonas sp. TaxID=213418 RepID=UPI0025CCBE00|nr:hypothetical protein [uncultured Brevundimonas sp.]